MDSFPSFANLPKRHYKKDSRFVNDLYTLTYDDHESVDTVELISVFNKRVSKRKILILYKLGTYLINFAIIYT